MSLNYMTFFNEKEDPFWFDSLEILYRKDKLIEFVPTPKMSMVERLNALVRFCFYLSVLLFMYRDNVQYFYIFIFALILTYVIRMYLDDSDQEGFEAKKRKCNRPTVHNPFMNPNLITDFGKDFEGCNVYDTSNLKENEKVKEEIEKNFSYNLYQDIDDVYNTNNSQRQFFTVPGRSIPNDQTAFAKWLYTDDRVCKSGDTDACWEYRDARFDRFPVMQKVEKDKSVTIVDV